LLPEHRSRHGEHHRGIVNIAGEYCHALPVARLPLEWRLVFVANDA
jgi:hypothetical protein